MDYKILLSNHLPEKTYRKFFIGFKLEVKTKNAPLNFNPPPPGPPASDIRFPPSAPPFILPNPV